MSCHASLELRVPVTHMGESCTVGTVRQDWSLPAHIGTRCMAGRCCCTFEIWQTPGIWQQRWPMPLHICRECSSWWPFQGGQHWHTFAYPFLSIWHANTQHTVVGCQAQRHVVANARTLDQHWQDLEALLHKKLLYQWSCSQALRFETMCLCQDLV
jgi:hypothetical protein